MKKISIVLVIILATTISIKANPIAVPTPANMLLENINV